MRGTHTHEERETNELQRIHIHTDRHKTHNVKMREGSTPPGSLFFAFSAKQQQQQQAERQENQRKRYMSTERERRVWGKSVVRAVKVGGGSLLHKNKPKIK